MINKSCDGIRPKYASKVTPYDSELSTNRSQRRTGRYHEAHGQNGIQYCIVGSMDGDLFVPTNTSMKPQPWVLAKDPENKKQRRIRQCDGHLSRKLANRSNLAATA